MKISHDINTLLDVFGVEAVNTSPVLEAWLSVVATLSASQSALLEEVQMQMLAQGGEWNEEELKVKFLSFLFFIADIEKPKHIQTFYERPLSATINGIDLSVKCDCMVATPKGKGAPKLPCFFLQEFKRQKGDKQDPEGQMFAAMLVAQYLNADQKPIYGAWLVGNQWTFAVLDDKKYACSRYYDATNSNDLLAIVAALRALKNLIINR